MAVPWWKGECKLLREILSQARPSMSVPNNVYSWNTPNRGCTYKYELVSSKGNLQSFHSHPFLGLFTAPQTCSSPSPFSRSSQLQHPPPRFPVRPPNATPSTMDTWLPSPEVWSMPLALTFWMTTTNTLSTATTDNPTKWIAFGLNKKNQVTYGGGDPLFKVEFQVRPSSVMDRSGLTLTLISSAQSCPKLPEQKASIDDYKGPATHHEPHSTMP